MDLLTQNADFVALKDAYLKLLFSQNKASALLKEVTALQETNSRLQAEGVEISDLGAATLTKKQTSLAAANGAVAQNYTELSALSAEYANLISTLNLPQNAILKNAYLAQPNDLAAQLAAHFSA